MITSRWSDRLDDATADEARALVEVAAEYDAESGFAAIDRALVGRQLPDEDETRHLAVWSSPDGDLTDDAPQVLAAYGRAVVNERDRDTMLQFVVHPDFRSRGVATLLLENSGLGSHSASSKSSVRVRWWAYGDHPAADRIARRFAIGVFERRWTMLRSMRRPAVAEELGPRVELASYDGPKAEAALRELSDGAGDAVEAALEAVQVDDAARLHLLSDGSAVLGFSVSATGRPRATSLGTVSRIRAVSVMPTGASVANAHRILLSAALRDVAESGAGYAELRLDPADEALLDACRLAGFEPEQSDVGYELAVSGP